MRLGSRSRERVSARTARHRNWKRASALLTPQKRWLLIAPLNRILPIPPPPRAMPQSLVNPPFVPFRLSRFHRSPDIKLVIRIFVGHASFDRSLVSRLICHGLTKLRPKAWRDRHDVGDGGNVVFLRDPFHERDNDVVETIW